MVSEWTGFAQRKQLGQLLLYSSPPLRRAGEIIGILLAEHCHGVGSVKEETP